VKRPVPDGVEYLPFPRLRESTLPDYANVVRLEQAHATRDDKWSIIEYTIEYHVRGIMDYVTVRELRTESGKVWDRVAAGEEFVITRNGKPFALLLHTEPAEVEAALRAYRAARLGTVLDRLQNFSAAKGLDKLAEEDIEAEITAARKERRSANAAPRGR
jgi:prevent-host-death family protein